MSNIRRWYFYVVSGISLQVVTWAAIVLLRDRTVDAVAFLAAVIIVALPLFLLHWRWATRSEADIDPFEEDYLRVLYLYTMLAAFLFPLVFNVRTLLDALLTALFEAQSSSNRLGSAVPASEIIINAGLTILVLGILALYHWRLLREENLAAEKGVPATIRRVFVYLFTASGLTMFSFGLAQLLTLVRLDLSGAGITPAYLGFTKAAALVGTGLVVWLPFWRYAEQLFAAGDEEERASALRKFYLYLVVFVGTFMVVTDLTVIGATLLRRWLGLEPLEDSGVIFSTLIVGALLWTYHAYVLMEDGRAAPDVQAQSSIRRIYWYLVSAIGLLVLLIGLGSIISVIINAVGDQAGITESFREQLSWSVASLAAGLIVWLLPWRSIQKETELPAPQGFAARSAAVRRNYLYGFILVATLTFLVCVIFLVYALFASVLGVTSDISFTAMAQAFAFALLAVAVWLYHGSLLRRDNETIQAAAMPFGEHPVIVIVDDGDGRLGRGLHHALRAALPEAEITTLGLSPEARAELVNEDQPLPAVQILTGANIIVSPWFLVVPHPGATAETQVALAAMTASPAHKILIPKALEKWDFAGVGEWNKETAIRQVVQAVKQINAGEPVVPKSPLGIGRILLILIGLFFLLLMFLTLVSGLFGF